MSQLESAWVQGMPPAARPGPPAWNQGQPRPSGRQGPPLPERHQNLDGYSSWQPSAPGMACHGPCPSELHLSYPPPCARTGMASTARTWGSVCSLATRTGCPDTQPSHVQRYHLTGT